MIKKDKQRNALKSLQAVIIKARTMVYENEDLTNIADILDGAEYLAALIHDKEDKTDVFKDYLMDISNSHKCLNALDIFDEKNEE